MNAFALLAELGDTTSSFLDLVSSKDAFSLDLLDQDEFLSEVIAHQPRLLSLLLAPEAAQLQLRLALGEWQGLTDTEEKGMRYAHMCSEVFCMDVQPIQDFMLSREFDTGAPFLARLLAILDRDAPLYVVPIQNFCKITSSLIKHRRKETFEALKNHPGFVKRLVVHAAGSSPRVAELLGQFMEYESVDPLGVVEWLEQENFVPLLLAQLNNDKDDVEVAAAALSVLTLLVQSSGPDAPLVLSALSEASVLQVITFTFAHVAQSNDSAINRKRLISGLEFVRTLLDWCVSFAPNQGGEEAAAIKKKKRGLWLVGAEARNASYTDAHLEGLSAKLEELVELLKTSLNEDGRFGTVKLEVGRFLSALLRTNNASVLRSFLQLGILPLCLGLFFDKTLLNMWHHEVLKMVIHTLEGHSEELLVSLFEQGNLLQRIVSSTQPENRRSEQGHLGHVYLIAQAITASTQPRVKEFTEANAEWQAFVGTTLRQLTEQNEYSQYAPDEAMRNATTVCSDKITDLQVDEPDSGPKRPSPAAAAPRTANAVSSWAKFDDDEEDWTTATPTTTAFVAAPITPQQVHPDWASFGDDEADWAKPVPAGTPLATTTAVNDTNANWASFGDDEDWVKAQPPKREADTSSADLSTQQSGGSSNADWATFDDDADWAKFEG